ncbi:MAG: hypothetical protein HKN37_16465 [Rhodothermales bacterium]|nr:hypothetical protein [Rhodothermales bacterium]
MRTLAPILLIFAAAFTRCEESRNLYSAEPAIHDSASEPLDLARLSWMQGYWTGEQDGTRMEEVWLPARGNVMVGMHVDLFASGRSFFEYLRIEQRGDTLVFHASPRGRPPTPFIASGVTDSSVTFENLAHDFPQMIAYRVDRAGRLHARISGQGDGEEQSSEWIWSRSDLPRP